MRELTAAERKKLMLAGETCYNELLSDINHMDMADIPEFSEEKIRNAEQAAWEELRVLERKRMVKRWSMVAACLLVAVGVVMLSAKPTVANQKFWNKLFVKDNGTSMSISSNAAALVPDDWNGRYVPMEIPQGYHIENVDGFDTMYSIYYENEAGNYIQFDVTVGEFNLHLDTENCEIEDVQIGGMSGLARTKYINGEKVYSSVMWYDENTCFVLDSNVLIIESLMSIAESVMKYTE